MPETISTLEAIRFLVALFGINAAWTGRALVLTSLSEIPTNLTADVHERSARAQRHERMDLFVVIQNAILLVHFLLLVNVLTNFGYPSAPIEQMNILTSNLAQILIPIILSRASEWMSAEIRMVGRLRDVVGPRLETP